MPRVLLLNPPGKQLHLRDQHCSGVSKADYYWPPLDLVIQSGILSAEHEIGVIDAIIEKLDEWECLKRISHFRPDAVLALTGMSSWREDFSFLQKVKKDSGATLIVSGDLLLARPAEFLEKYLFLDAILLDFTSDVLGRYLNPAYRGKLYDICYRKDNTVLLEPMEKKRTYAIPVPRHELFPLEKYRLPHGRYHPFASVAANYGCPYQCSYCISEHIAFKYRPAENVLPELEKLMSLGVREIFFKDFTFGLPRKECIKLCQGIIEKLPGLSWIASSRVNVLDEEMLILMKKAGCHTVQFGVESGSQRLLDEYNKHISLAQIENAFALCSRLGIKTLAHFILGLPGETEESLRETIRLAKRLNCTYASFNIAVPLPGTTLRQRCLENGWLLAENEELDASRSYPVMETALLSREKLWKLRNHAIRSFYLRPSYIIKTLLSIRSPRMMLQLCRQGVSLLFTLKR